MPPLLRRAFEQRHSHISPERPRSLLTPSTVAPEAGCAGPHCITVRVSALKWSVPPNFYTVAWSSTTSWMTWNVLAPALLQRSSIVMIDGDLAPPGLRSYQRRGKDRSRRSWAPRRRG